jgi:polysaccharide export outer membrane protein
MNFQKSSWICAVLLILFVVPGFAQKSDGERAPGKLQSTAIIQPVTYVLGPGDEFVISSDAAEIDGKTVRIAPGGEVNLPLVGEIHASGLSIRGLQAVLVDKLKPFYRNPYAAVNMIQFRSQPVSVYGAVVSNGEFQLEGKKTLSQIISKAGGPRSDAGYRVIIRRAREHDPIPLASNKPDPSGNYFIAEVRLRDLMNATHPEDDIEILGGDTITVPPGEIVFVSGAVIKEGGYVIDDATIPVKRLIALAGGTKPTAKLKDAVILREVGGKLMEIPINLVPDKKNKMLNVELLPRDILVIDDSAVRGAFRRTTESILQTITGLAIYRLP